MHLNINGRVAEKELLNILLHYESAKIDKYIMMPNHVHVIFTLVGVPLAAPVNAGEPKVGRASPRHTVGNVVRGYKAGVSRRLGVSCWQRSYHDHIIRNEAACQRIWQYMDENPLGWYEDCYYTV